MMLIEVNAHTVMHCQVPDILKSGTVVLVVWGHDCQDGRHIKSSAPHPAWQHESMSWG